MPLDHVNSCAFNKIYVYHVSTWFMPWNALQLSLSNVVHTRASALLLCWCALMFFRRQMSYLDGACTVTGVDHPCVSTRVRLAIRLEWRCVLALATLYITGVIMFWVVITSPSFRSYPWGIIVSVLVALPCIPKVDRKCVFCIRERSYWTGGVLWSNEGEMRRSASSYLLSHILGLAFRVKSLDYFGKKCW